MSIQVLGPRQKALQINLNDKIYGSFVEIGAGQEVARYFFQAGGAAGTIAKSISAYDMIVSDTIYGKEDSGRYVCESRLLKMLNREYDQLHDRLGPTRGENTQFFSFADTVAAKSFSGRGECHGWLGVRFQDAPGKKYSELIVHVRMLDQENIQQQEAVGLIGVNMVYACFNHAKNPEKFVESLMENLTTRRIEIDMIRVSGEAFDGVDSRVLSLELVKKKFTYAVMFDCDGSVIQARDTLYKKNLLVSRGSFRPPTHVNIDMLECGQKMMRSDLGNEDPIYVLPEISMSKLIERGSVDNNDFLARVDLLSTLNHCVLITNFDSYFELNSYLQGISKKKISFVTGIYNLEEILQLSNYENKPSGMLGGLGELFGDQTNLYIYPVVDDEDSSKLRKLDDVNYDKSVTMLVKHLLNNDLIKDVTGYNPDYSGIWSRTVLKMIENSESGWEKMVPESVAKSVKENNLFKKN